MCNINKHNKFLFYKIKNRQTHIGTVDWIVFIFTNVNHLLNNVDYKCELRKDISVNLQIRKLFLNLQGIISMIENIEFSYDTRNTY